MASFVLISSDGKIADSLGGVFPTDSYDLKGSRLSMKEQVVVPTEVVGSEFLWGNPQKAHVRVSYFFNQSRGGWLAEIEVVGYSASRVRSMYVLALKRLGIETKQELGFGDLIQLLKEKFAQSASTWDRLMILISLIRNG